MPKYYLARTDGTYSDVADYAEQPADRAEGTWFEGEPPEDGILFGGNPLIDRLKAILEATPTEVQVQFGTAAAAVEMFIRNDNLTAAQATIEAIEVPEELASLKAQMLSEFE